MTSLQYLTWLFLDYVPLSTALDLAERFTAAEAREDYAAMLRVVEEIRG